MATVTNTTTHELFVPALERILKAGETVEADLDRALKIGGHGVLRVETPETARSTKKPAAPAATPEPVTA